MTEGTPMTTFVATMEEFFAMSLGKYLAEEGFNTNITTQARSIKDNTVREAALCLAIDSTPLLEATMRAQKDWLQKLQSQLNPLK